MCLGISRRPYHAGLPSLGDRQLEQAAQAQAGMSLVECLVANALTLTLLVFLMATGAQLMQSVNVAAARADQQLRLHQLGGFLDSALGYAGLPPSWQNDSRLFAEDALAAIALSDPCTGPESAGYRDEWGGVALIDTARSDCFPGGTVQTGLYIETVRPCPEACAADEGYVLVPAGCDGGEVLEQQRSAWRAQWQSDRSTLPGCADAATWGALDRLFLVYRRASDVPDSSPALRLQTPVSSADYRWGAAEVLIEGVARWTVSRAELPLPSAIREAVDGRREPLPHHVTERLSAFRAEMAVAADAETSGGALLSASKLLVWPALIRVYAL